MSGRRAQDVRTFKVMQCSTVPEARAPPSAAPAAGATRPRSSSDDVARRRARWRRVSGGGGASSSDAPAWGGGSDEGGASWAAYVRRLAAARATLAAWPRARDLKPQQLETLEFALQRELRPVAAATARPHGGGILADDMGTGKTVTTIALCVANPQPEPTLVVCPVSVVRQWRDEILAWHPGAQVRVIEQRARDTAAPVAGGPGGGPGGFVVTTYAMFQAARAVATADEGGGYSAVFATAWGRVVLDEAQVVSTPSNVTYERLLHLVSAHARHVWLLTGTPLSGTAADNVRSLVTLESVVDGRRIGKRHGGCRQQTLRARCGGASAEAAAATFRRAYDRLMVRHLTPVPPPVRRHVRVEFAFEWERAIYARVLVGGYEGRGAGGGGCDQLRRITRLRQLCMGVACMLQTATSHFDGSAARQHEMRWIRRVFDDVGQGDAGYAVSKAMQLAPSSSCCAPPPPAVASRGRGGPAIITTVGAQQLRARLAARRAEIQALLLAQQQQQPSCPAAALHEGGGGGGCWPPMEEHLRAAAARVTRGLFFSAPPRHSTKLLSIMEQLRRDTADHGGAAPPKTIVFMEQRLAMRHLCALLESAGVRHVLYDGEMSPDAREQAIRRYGGSAEGAPGATNVLVMQIRAGNCGLSLEMTRHVYVSTPCWNPMVENQAVARALRLCTRHRVTYTLFTVAGTVEDDVIRRQQRKRTQVREMLDEGGGQSPAPEGSSQDAEEQEPSPLVPRPPPKRNKRH